MVDPPLAAIFRLEGLDRDAIRSPRAVSAAFADAIVDEHAPRGLGQRPPFAPATFFVRTDLIVDKHGDAGDFPQLLLDRHEVGAWAHDDAGRQVGCAGVAARILGYDHRARDALGGQLSRDLRDSEAAFRRLAAGHSHGVIEKQLVGEVRSHGDGPAHGQGAGVIIGPVAQIDEDVPLAGER